MSYFPVKKPPTKKGGKKRGTKKKKAPPKNAVEGGEPLKPKGRPKAEIKYTEEDLKQAIKLVKSGESVWKISRQYGIKYDVLASATKISYYGLMYKKCKGEKPKDNVDKDDKKDGLGTEPMEEGKAEERSGKAETLENKAMEEDSIKTEEPQN